jgi:hypothetical protein
MTKYTSLDRITRHPLWTKILKSACNKNIRVKIRFGIDFKSNGQMDDASKLKYDKLISIAFKSGVFASFCQKKLSRVKRQENKALMICYCSVRKNPYIESGEVYYIRTMGCHKPDGSSPSIVRNEPKRVKVQPFNSDEEEESSLDLSFTFE